MKNTIYLLLLILVTACGKTEIQPTVNSGTNNATPIQQEVVDFFSHHATLTEQDLEDFSAAIILDDNENVIGGRFSDIEKALTKEEATDFWTIVFGEPVIFVNELKDKNITYNLTGACPVVLVENYISIAGNSIHAEGARCKTATGYFCRQFVCAE